jgi:hypothetical protein
MGCAERQAKLTEWILDELPPADAEELERHVQQCAECGRSAERVRIVHETLTKNLTGRVAPAHLVFLPETRKKALPALLSPLWRAAAGGAVAAVVFLTVTWIGFSYRTRYLLLKPSAETAALTPADVKVLTEQIVTRELALQRKEVEAANANLAAVLRQEQMSSLARVSRQLDYLETTQSAVWKQAQQQGALVQLIARNSLKLERAQPGNP